MGVVRETYGSKYGRSSRYVRLKYGNRYGPCYGRSTLTFFCHIPYELKVMNTCVG